MKNKTKIEELKPCPFCGGEAEIGEAEYARTFFYAFCTQCFAGIQSCKTTDEAITEWNTRVEPKTISDDALLGIINELDAYALFVDSYDYGLPTYDEHLPAMIEICKKAINDTD